MPLDPALELETRRRIFHHVEQRPGSYLREIQRALDMPMGMLEYHLGRLERAGLVTVLRAENKRFFPQSMTPADKRALALLRQEACRTLVLALLERPGATRSELAEALSYRPSTLSYYLGKVVDSGLGVVSRQGREHQYALADPEHVHGLLVRHRPTFMDRLLDAFLDSFEGPT